MKRIAYIITILLIAAGCTEKPADTPVKGKTLTERIAGEWHCTISELDTDLYLEILSDSSFGLYQKIGDGSYRLYKGKWSLDEESETLSGKYNDGTSWGSIYKVKMSEDNNLMTLIPEASKDEEHLYNKTEIPSNVKEGCIVEVKSGPGGVPVL